MDKLQRENMIRRAVSAAPHRKDVGMFARSLSDKDLVAFVQRLEGVHRPQPVQAAAAATPYRGTVRDRMERLFLEVARLERQYLPARHAQRRSESQPVQQQRAVDGYRVTPAGLQAVTRLEGPHVVTPQGLEKASAHR